MRLRSALMLKSNNSERYSEGLLMYRFSYSDFLRFMHNSFPPTKYRVSRKKKEESVDTQKRIPPEIAL